MILFLNTSKEKQLDVFLIDNNKIIGHKSLKDDFKVSENLLKLIKDLLDENKINFNCLKGIMAISGPGPFTSLRIEAAVANTLAFALKIPVLGIKNKKGKLADKQLTKLGLQNLKRTKIGNYIIPFYGSEPNITIAKK